MRTRKCCIFLQGSPLGVERKAREEARFPYLRQNSYYVVSRKPPCANPRSPVTVSSASTRNKRPSMTPAPATEAMQRRVLLRKHRELRLHVNKLYRTIEDAKSALAQVQLSLAATVNELATTRMPATRFAASPPEVFLLSMEAEDIEARLTPSPVKAALAFARSHRHAHREPSLATAAVHDDNSGEVPGWTLPAHQPQVSSDQTVLLSTIPPQSVNFEQPTRARVGMARRYVRPDRFMQQSMDPWAFSRPRADPAESSARETTSAAHGMPALKQLSVSLPSQSAAYTLHAPQPPAPLPHPRPRVSRRGLHPGSTLPTRVETKPNLTWEAMQGASRKY
jgi:hypothetical protein